MFRSLISVTAFTLGLPMLGGCNTINVKQMAYEALAQEDCRRNQLESFCSRGFHNEYKEYERTRRNFLRAQLQEPWRADRHAMQANAY